MISLALHHAYTNRIGPANFPTTAGCIDVVEEIRKDLLMSMLKDNTLRSYLSWEYQMDDVSDVRICFIKKSLQELMATPVDQTYFARVILEIKKHHPLTLSGEYESLFFAEIKKAIGNQLL